MTNSKLALSGLIVGASPSGYYSTLNRIHIVGWIHDHLSQALIVRFSDHYRHRQFRLPFASKRTKKYSFHAFFVCGVLIHTHTFFVAWYAYRKLPTIHCLRRAFAARFYGAITRFAISYCWRPIDIVYLCETAFGHAVLNGCMLNHTILLVCQCLSAQHCSLLACWFWPYSMVCELRYIGVFMIVRKKFWQSKQAKLLTTTTRKKSHKTTKKWKYVSMNICCSTRQRQRGSTADL